MAETLSDLFYALVAEGVGDGVLNAPSTIVTQFTNEGFLLLAQFPAFVSPPTEF